MNMSDFQKQIDPEKATLIINSEDMEDHFKYLKKLMITAVTFICLSFLFGFASLIVIDRNVIAGLIILIFALFIAVTSIFMLFSAIKQWYSPYPGETSPLNV